MIIMKQLIYLLSLPWGQFYISKPPLIVMGISTIKMFLIFINILRAEEEMRCFISFLRSTKPPYILKVTSN